MPRSVSTRPPGLKAGRTTSPDSFDGTNVPSSKAHPPRAGLRGCCALGAPTDFIVTSYGVHPRPLGCRHRCPFLFWHAGAIP
jgi:hypothetical protein